ncbi:MAG: hypothetical protein DI535_17145 [Citrobacter freundii]|nr:MAG: hypothetical protein DI535_17145 [Citrobacter freundii]
MKRLLLICVAFLSVRGMAQPPAYPAQLPPAPILKAVEYFFDADPGPGKGQSIVLPATTNASSFQFQADLSTLQSGFHRLYIRSMDADNNWSMTNSIFFDNYALPAYPVQSAAPNIVAVEYFLNTDPGPGNATAIPLAPAADQQSKTISIDLTGLDPRVHRLYIRSKDANGKWSLTNFSQFDNTALNPYPSAPPAAPPIGEMEYYFDTDPGFGKGTPITFTAGMDISNFSVNIPLNSISQGAHTFYIRSRQNPWSLSAYVPFMYSSTLPVTWLYVKGEIKADRSFISWATATEEETDKFLVEHSTDGQHFATIGEVKAAGNSGSTQHYNFTHDKPVKGMNYYRIKQLDKNGKFTYSKALHLLYHPDQREVMIAPNPASDNLYIISGTGNELQKAELYDMSGKLILTRQLGSGQQVYGIDINTLNKGVYIIKLYDKQHSTSHRIIKQ